MRGAGQGQGMRLALLVLAAALLGLAAAPTGAGFNACAQTSDGAAAFCAAVDWEDPSACARFDVNPPSGHAGQGTCFGTS